MQRVGMGYHGIARWYNLDVIVYKLSRQRYEHNQSAANRLDLKPGATQRIDFPEPSFG